MSSSSSPCAACKFLRRKCTQECVFAPYFPADQPQKFASVHKVFGASNVAKLLSELNVTQREDAVRSLVYEADARLSDPIYGCVGLISILQHRLRQLHQELEGAKKELSTYIGPQAMGPILHPSPFMQQQQQQQQQQNLGYPSSSSSVMPHGMMPLMGMPSGPIHGGQLVMREPRQQYQHHAQQPQQHDIIEAQQLAAAAVAAREQQEMYRAYEQQQQQPQQQLQQQHQTQQPQQQQQLDLLRSNSGFEGTVPVTATGFHHHLGAGAMPPSLALGTSDNPYQVQPQADNQWLLFQPEQAEAQPHSQSQLETPQTQQQPQVSGSNERGSFGPSWSILLKLLFLATVFEAIFHSSP